MALHDRGGVRKEKRGKEERVISDGAKVAPTFPKRATFQKDAKWMFVMLQNSAKQAKIDGDIVSGDDCRCKHRTRAVVQYCTVCIVDDSTAVDVGPACRTARRGNIAKCLRARVIKPYSIYCTYCNRYAERREGKGGKGR